MKLEGLFALFTLCVIVNGWVETIPKIILSLGAASTAHNFDLDLMSEQRPIVWKNWSDLWPWGTRNKEKKVVDKDAKMPCQDDSNKSEEER